MNRVKNNDFRVMIVEDEVSIRELYKMKLELEGFTVDTASNGTDGLKLIEDTQPSLVLLDLRMPGMDGDEMLTRLRATEFGATVRVIILTNISKSEAPMRLRFLNVDRYVVKAHHTPSQIAAMVNELLNR